MRPLSERGAMDRVRPCRLLPASGSPRWSRAGLTGPPAPRRATSSSHLDRDVQNGISVASEGGSVAATGLPNGPAAHRLGPHTSHSLRATVALSPAYEGSKA